MHTIALMKKVTILVYNMDINNLVVYIKFDF